MSIDIQKWKAEAHENAAKTVANMLQVGIVHEITWEDIPKLYKIDLIYINNCEI